jgi:hypothetical protein
VAIEDALLLSESENRLFVLKSPKNVDQLLPCRCRECRLVGRGRRGWPRSTERRGGGWRTIRGSNPSIDVIAADGPDGRTRTTRCGRLRRGT